MKTDYIHDFRALASDFDLNITEKCISLNGHRDFELVSCPFLSKADFVYPETGDYASKGNTFKSLLRYYCSNNKYSNDFIFNALEYTDREITENMKFRIPIFKPAGNRSFSNAVFLLHGLNEKHWTKYLPWALRIMEETDSPVILFPIAFHMNRAPEAWSSPRDMIRVAAERKKFVDEGGETSFVNAAISHRIQFAPHRFFSSGMQTYYDIIRFIDETRLGSHPFINKNCRFDFFSYSIGASLTEVLLTSNFNSYFSDSKAFLFCGGAALDTADPVSRTIIDKEAYVELFSWLGSLFESVTDMGRRVKEIFFQELPEIVNFKSFLFYDKMQQHREASLKRSGGMIMETGLEKDTVFPPETTSRTLKGFKGDIDIKTERLDFPYQYCHEEPFPLTEGDREAVNRGFDEVFTIASDFFNKSA